MDNLRGIRELISPEAMPQLHESIAAGNLGDSFVYIYRPVRALRINRIREIIRSINYSQDRINSPLGTEEMR